MNVRGLGTFCSVDFPDGLFRDSVITKLRNRGNVSSNSPLYYYLDKPLFLKFSPGYNGI